MPDNNPPMRGGRASNRTAQYLSEIGTDHPGQQAFYRQALTGIPHPLQAGHTLNYGQLQDLLTGPQGAAARDAYANANQMHRTPSTGQMEAELFTRAHDQLLARAAAHPDHLAFGPDADAALRAPLNERNMAHGNYASVGSGQLSNPLAQAQRFNDLPASSAYVAPSMAAAAPAPLSPQLTNVLQSALAGR